MRVGLAHRDHRLGPQVRRVHLGDDLVAATLLHRLADPLVRLAALGWGSAPDRGRIGWLQPGHLLQGGLGSQAVHRGGVHPSVRALVEARLVHSGRIGLRQHGMVPAARARGLVPDHRRVSERPLVERCLQPLTPAGELPGAKSGGHADRQHETRGHARRREVQEYRSVPPARLLVLQASSRLDERVVAGASGISACSRIGRCRGEHETWEPARVGPRRRAPTWPSSPERSSRRARRLKRADPRARRARRRRSGRG